MSSGDVALNPRVENARAVDAEQHAQTGLPLLVIDVRKRVYARKGVVVHRAVDAVDHARRAGGGGYLARIEYVERQGVVRLVAGAVGNRRAGAQSQQAGGLRVHRALQAEGRHGLGDEALVEPVAGEQFFREAVVLEIPENAFGESRNGGAHFAREPHGDVVAGQHDFVDFLEDGRLVFLYPRQFRGGEVAGRIEQMLQTERFAQRAERPLAVGHGAAVAPDNGGTQHLPLFIDHHQPVHLIRDADGFYFRAVDARLRQHRLRGGLQIFPPAFGVLFRPAGLLGDDFHFTLRREIGGDAHAGICIDQRRFYRRTAYVIS